MASNSYFITHLVPEELPTSGLRKLLFYTVKYDESEKKENYYWGRGNKPFDSAYMSKLVRDGKVLLLSQKILLEEKKGLWLDPDGKVYYANLEKPFSDPDKKLIAAPTELKKVNQFYKNFKATHGTPKVVDRIGIPS